jgi:hypothetical protein
VAKKGTIVLDLITRRFQKKMKDANKSWKRMKKNIFSVKSAIGVVFAGAALRQMVSFGRNLVGAAKEQQQSEQQLIGALRARGMATADVIKRMKEFATEIQLASTFGDEAVLSQEAYLVSLGRTEAEMQEMIRASADLAAGTGRDLDFAVRNLAKTFAGTTGELGELLPEVRLLTAEELKAGKAVGVVAEMFRGQAKALIETPTGKLTQMAGAFRDIQQSIGAGVADSVAKIASSLSVSADSMVKFNDSAGQFMALKISGEITNLAAGMNLLAGAMGKVAATFLQIVQFTPIGLIGSGISTLLGGETLFGAGTRIGRRAGTQLARGDVLSGISAATLAEYDQSMAGSVRREKNRAANRSK